MLQENRSIKYLSNSLASVAGFGIALCVCSDSVNKAGRSFVPAGWPIPGCGKADGCAGS